MISHQKRFVALLAVGIVFLSLTVFAILLPRNPRDLKLPNGKRLSHQLLLGYAPGLTTNSTASAARDAIRLAGTNSLPLLVEWLRTETPSLNKRIGRQLWALGVQTTLFPPDDLAVVACKAVPLGMDGVEIAGELVAASTNENLNVANMATAVLMRQSMLLSSEFPAKKALEIRKPLERAIQVLQRRSALANSNAESERIRVLKGIQQRFLSSPYMMAGLKDEDLQAQMHYARILSRRGAAYGEAEPVLWSHLESNDARVVEHAVICLKNYGGKASSSIVRIEQAFSHPDEKVRQAATNAVTRIKALQN